MANPTFTALANSSVSVVLEGWEGRAAEFAGEGVLVSLEGLTAPRGFRSKVRSYNYPLTALWPAWMGAEALSLVSLFETAWAAVDGRIVVEHGDKFGQDIQPTSIVQVQDWTIEVRQGQGGIYAVSFTMYGVS